MGKITQKKKKMPSRMTVNSGKGELTDSCSVKIAVNTKKHSKQSFVLE